MSAIFDVSSLCTVLLLMICTSTYLRELRPTIFDAGYQAGFDGSSSSIGTNPATTPGAAPKSGDYINYMEGNNDPNQHFQSQQHIMANQHHARPKRTGVLGFLWKLSRIGERLSPYVGAGCAIMAINILFFK